MSVESARVSVITPVYNGAEFLVECIESVLAQSYRNFEYVILNNCSKDDTLAIARSYAAKDSRISVHDASTFVGVIDNHNRAFRMMSRDAKYCKVLSADDFLFPECLSQMVGLAEANPSVGLVGSYSLAGKQVMWDGLEYERKVVSGRELCHDTLLGGAYLFGAPSTNMYRADLVRRYENFFPWINPHADTSACYQLLQHADFGFVHQVLSYTRIHAQSETSSSLKFGTINRALIHDLVEYGPLYLNAEEQRGRLGYLLDKYYEWLVPALIEQSFNKEFLEKQKAGLKEIGFELDPAKLLKATLRNGVELVKQPRATMAKAVAGLQKKGKVEAGYY